MLNAFRPVNLRPQVSPGPTEQRPGSTEEDAVEATRQRIRQLPPEVGAVLLGVGFVGLIIPGPVGTPLILAGGIALIPSVFGRVESWLHKKFPKSHRVGMKYVDRFIDDYERRFPPQAS